MVRVSILQLEKFTFDISVLSNHSCSTDDIFYMFHKSFSENIFAEKQSTTEAFRAFSLYSNIKLLKIIALPLLFYIKPIILNIFMI
jgi:hypothetical protein